MGTVYYLCYSDIPEKTGLVFPSELEPESYSLGIWAVAIKRGNRFPEIFEFDAVNDNQITSTKLVKVSRSLYQPQTTCSRQPSFCSPAYAVVKMQ